ncbi:ShlB/FhaC/HecB family hemolysin secretion/activation protein [uncultured Aquincola sp.]|uniref:ShlB/FhaC/HecB family hemolysin secretion/activation protein n=1 Tax=uncultured Aquincola sp. TaxID=886556 RepID=UPI0032B1F9B6
MTPRAKRRPALAWRRVAVAAATCAVAGAAWPPAVAQPAPAESGASAEPTVTVQAFEIEGAEQVGVDELQAVLAPWRGRPLTRQALGEAARAVERHYQVAHRRLARVTLPPQDVTDGRVRLRVSEGRLGRVVVQAEGLRAIAPERAVAAIEALQPRGQALSLSAVERATMQLAEWPGLEVRSSLVAGSGAGETDVALVLTDRRPWDLQLRADNEGARATGHARVSADGWAVLPGGGGHAVTAGTMVSEGSRLLRLGASTPLPDAGWRASVYGSALDYRLVTPEFNSLDVKGPSQSLGLGLSWAIDRSAFGSRDASAQLERRWFRNKALDTVLSDYRIDVLTLRYARQSSDEAGDARRAWELSLAVGDVDLTGSPNREADALTADTAGGYALLRGAWQYGRQAGAQARWLVRASGQWTGQNLDVSERMPIAGPAGVRGYPVGEATGSRAWLGSAEWQQGLAGLGQPALTLAGFADTGVAWQYADAGFAGAPTHNRLRLSAAGLWLEWRPQAWPLVTRLTVARPLGHHPHPTANGSNQDGSHFGTRWWWSAQWSL